MELTNSVLANESTSAIQGRDVLTEPPTVVWITSDSNWRCPRGEFVVSMDDVEKTDGLAMHDGRGAMSICFMHSFGKCSGKTGGQASSCQQLHIRRAALDALRSSYTLPYRTHFFRTVKLQLDSEVRKQLQLVNRRTVSIQYLEFRSQDVSDTIGLQEYERHYREWLRSDTTDLTYTTNACLCWSYATRGICPLQERCPRVHANLSHALTRDRAILAALNTLAKHGGSYTEYAAPPPPLPPPRQNPFVLQQQWYPHPVMGAQQAPQLMQLQPTFTQIYVPQQQFLAPQMAPPQPLQFLVSHPPQLVMGNYVVVNEFPMR